MIFERAREIVQAFGLTRIGATDIDAAAGRHSSYGYRPLRSIPSSETRFPASAFDHERPDGGLCEVEAHPPIDITATGWRLFGGPRRSVLAPSGSGSPLSQKHRTMEESTPDGSRTQADLSKSDAFLSSEPSIVADGVDPSQAVQRRHQDPLLISTLNKDEPVVTRRELWSYYRRFPFCLSYSYHEVLISNSPRSVLQR
jgi:hypothetical protein